MERTIVRSCRTSLSPRFFFFYFLSSLANLCFDPRLLPVPLSLSVGISSFFPIFGPCIRVSSRVDRRVVNFVLQLPARRNFSSFRRRVRLFFYSWSWTSLLIQVHGDASFRYFEDILTFHFYLSLSHVTIQYFGDY